MLLDDATEKSAAYTELVAALAHAKRTINSNNKTFKRFKKKVAAADKSKTKKTVPGTPYQSVVGNQANALVPVSPDGNSNAQLTLELVASDASDSDSTAGTDDDASSESQE